VNTTVQTPVVTATAVEIPRLAWVLSSAFATNPVSDWLFDGEQDHHHPAFFTAFLNWAIDAGRVEQSADGTAVAVWIDYTTPPHPDVLARFDTEVAAAAHRHEVRWHTLDKATTAAHPRRSHWWLAFLAVLPCRQNRGHGSRLLAHAATWQTGHPTYLEATSRRLTRYYRRHRYQTVQDIQIPRGPVLHGMWQPSSAPADRV
jgi:GNAT superfamily N-acetyltransferase